VIESDKREFAQTLQGVYTEVYQRPELSVAALRVWWAALESIPIEAFRAALSAHVKTSRFAPTPADILALAGGTREDDARAAWYVVRRSIGRVGRYASVAFDDANIHRAINSMGGWPQLCQTEEADLPYRERDFIAAYRIAAQRGGPYPGHLAGVCEIENNARSTDVGPAVLIVGDRDRALAVIAAGAVAQPLPSVGARQLEAPHAP